MTPVERLYNHLSFLGAHVTVYQLEKALTDGDLQLVQGQRPAVNEHLAKHGQLSKEFFTEKE